MGEIVDLAGMRGHRVRESSDVPHGPAQVVLYTGVRYERAEPPTEPAKGPSRPRRRKPKLS